ncbi:MAG: MBL fold metallo-hydrolase [Bacteroidales bacterium]|nr:MBL fold metallo-hydrolase [Bacteroidales bacterium]MBN2763357.1 MBL fold metallo-hydrolase [Bacteroidales bacterium]
MSLFIRVNGCGNAWPVFLGTEHPFYDRMNADDMGSASYAVIGCMGKNYSPRTIEWEIIIDAGHNTVPFLLKNENRIPEALFLTHAHPDHITGVDWIAQSLKYTSTDSRKLPVYATDLCRQQVLETIPHLMNAVVFNELKPGRKEFVKEVPGLAVTAFPVYHGESSQGAAMLLVEYAQDADAPSVLFTGDLLFPFLRNEDYATISKAKVMYIDCSNRFSYPASNHISFTTSKPENGKVSNYLEEWQYKNPVERCAALQLKDANEDYRRYFDRFIQENNNYANIPFSVMEFLKKTGIPIVQLVHYSGYHDLKHYRQDELDQKALQKWAKRLLAVTGLKNVRLDVPKTGIILKL